MIGREAASECEVAGYRVAPGTTVLMSQWVVQRDPRFFDRPAEFCPERWLEPGIKDLPKFAYFPFGGGPRVCIGNMFALTEGALVLAGLAQRFHFQLADDHEVGIDMTFVLRPKGAVNVVVRKRS